MNRYQLRPPGQPRRRGPAYVIGTIIACGILAAIALSTLILVIWLGRALHTVITG